VVYNLVLFSLFHLNLFRCPVTIIYRWVFQLYYVHSKRKSFRTNDHWQNFSNEECKCMLKFRHGHNEGGYMSVEFFWNNICVFSLNSYHHADSVSWELLIKKNHRNTVLSTCKLFHTGASVKKTRRCFKRLSMVIWWSNNCIYVFLLIVTCWSFCSIISPIAAVLYITKVNYECLSLGAVNNIGWRFHG